METVAKSCPKSEQTKKTCTADALILPGQILQASDKEKDTFRIITYALKEAADAFVANELDEACAKYKIAFNLLLTENCEVQYYKKDIVQYMLCVCLINRGNAKDLRDALFLLCALETSIGNVFGAVYCALAKLHMKHYRFDFALKAVHKGFSFLNKNTKILQHCIPATNHVIRESTAEGLLNTLMALKEKCSNWHPPEAICNLADCNNGNEFYPPNKNIYFRDPMFDGMVTITCNNETHPCVLKYHQACWNHVKMKMSIRKLTDQETIGRRCVTPNCKNLSKFCIINKIEIYEPDGTTQTFTNATKFSFTFLTKETSPTGAIKKQSNSLEPEKKLRRPHAVQVPLLQQCTNQIPNKSLEEELNKDVNDNDAVFKSYESPIVPKTSVETKETKDPLKNGDQINNINCTTKNEEKTENNETEDNSDSKEKMQNQTVQSKESNNNDMDTPPQCDIKNKSVEQPMQSGTCAQGNPFLCYDTSNYAQYGTGYVLDTKNPENDWKIVDVNNTNHCETPAERAKNCNDELIHFDEIIKTLISFKQSNDICKKVEKDQEILAKSVTDSLLKEAHRNLKTNFDEPNMPVEELSTSEEPQCKISQSNVKNGCLLTETINIESNGKPLSEKKNAVINSYEKKHESLCKQLEACQKELIAKDDEIQTMHAKYFSMKQSMLQKHLYYQFTANKCFLERNIELCTIALGVINQVNYVFQRVLGYSVIKDNVEWLKAVGSFHELSAKNWEQYTLLKSLLEVREKVEEMDDIILNLPDIPPPPKRTLKDALHEGLSTYEARVMQIIQQLAVQVVRGPSPQSVVPKISWCVPPPAPHYAHASNDLSHFYNIGRITEQPVVNHNKPVMPAVKVTQGVNVDNKIQATDAHAAQTQNKSPKKNVDRSPEKKNNVEECKTVEAQDGAKSSLENNDRSSENNEPSASQCENTECLENIEIDSEACEEEKPPEEEYESLIDIPHQSALDNDKCDVPSDICDIPQEVAAMIHESDETQDDIQYVPLNFEEVMQILRTKYPGIMELDLLQSILTVKRMFNNTLSGVMLKTIINEVGKCILSRQKKYLCMYNTSAETLNATSTKNGKQKPTTSSIKEKGKKSTGGPLLRVTKKMSFKGNTAVKTLEKQSTAKSSSKGKETKGIIVKSKEPAKCPWNTQPTRNETWTKGSMETECIICMENIYERGKHVYTLDCKHTFHKSCVKEWFEHNQSCPTCRIHCTIDEEYPPLPS